jgi:hypothetical protein
LTDHDGDPGIAWAEANAANDDGEAVMRAEREAGEADAARGVPVTDQDATVRDLAALVRAVLFGDRTATVHAERIASRAGLGEDDSAEAIEAGLRKALGTAVPPSRPVLDGVPVEFVLGQGDTVTILWSGRLVVVKAGEVEYGTGGKPYGIWIESLTDAEARELAEEMTRG